MYVTITSKHDTNCNDKIWDAAAPLNRPRHRQLGATAALVAISITSVSISTSISMYHYYD